jgi:toxin FitB
MTVFVMYLIDTNVISELRKKKRANSGVISFMDQADEQKDSLFISAITIGELRRGIEIIRYRGDKMQAEQLAAWLEEVLNSYDRCILDFAEAEAQVWGQLRVPHPENSIDKQIAATALTCGLTLVTRNVKDFAGTGVALINPFS